ncbi:MAG: hypothetical protein AAFX53_06720 [Bacteroidota bacterium]
MISRLFTYVIGLFLCGLCIVPDIQAQEIDLGDYRMRFRFKSMKLANGSRLLEASFIAANRKDRKDRLPIYNAEIHFYTILEEEEIALGTAKTSKEGIATIALTKDKTFIKDGEGRIHFKAVFPGSDEMDGEEEEISIQDVQMELDLVEKDSVRTVIVTAHTLDSLGTKVPLEEADVILSVKGMLSKMVLDEGTIEDGRYEFEMPMDLPGNTEGQLEVYSSIEDHDDYGDVVQSGTANWGLLGKDREVDEGNTLWSDAAPIWMYVVLTILLVGIWANFAYTIINLRKIKKEGRELEMNQGN